MVDVQTGIIEELSIKDSGSTERADLLGIVSNATHDPQFPVTQMPSIGQGAKYQQNIDQVGEYTGSVTCMPHTLKALRFFGSYTDNGDGTYTIDPSEALDEYTMKQQKVDGGGVATLDKFKFGSFSLSAAETSDAMELSMDGMARDFKFDTTETINTPDVGGTARIPQETKVKMGGVVVGSVDTWTFDHNRNLEAFKGIEDFDTTDKLKPSQILEKMFDNSYTIIINIEDGRAYSEAMDQTGDVYEIGSRTNTDIDIVVDTAAGTDTLTLSGSRAQEITAEMANDAEKRTATVAGVALDWQVNGDLS